MITVYVIKSQHKMYRYVGITNNFERRLEEHYKTKKYYAPFNILIKEEFPDYETARVREKFLKSGQGRMYLNTVR